MSSVIERRAIPYGRQSIDEEDVQAVAEALRSDFLTQGPRIAEFEAQVARYCGARFAIAVNSGTAALHCALYGVGVGADDEVVVPTLTFAATANAACYLGARPVFCDVDGQDGCVDLNTLSQALTSATKAVVPVDFAGFPVDVRALRGLVGPGVKIVEDAAHALGARRDGRHAGAFADAAIFSFHPVKHITTGEGGMVVTDDEEVARRCSTFRNHGIAKEPSMHQGERGGWYYELRELGFNYRMTDIQAALGASQLRRLDAFVERRNELSVRYRDAFASEDGVRPLEARGHERHAYHLFVVRFDLKKLGRARREIYDAYHARGIRAQVHYLPVHLHPYYRKRFGTREGQHPAAEAFYADCLSLPLFPALTHEEQDYVIDCTKEILHA